MRYEPLSSQLTASAAARRSSPVMRSSERHVEKSSACRIVCARRASLQRRAVSGSRGARIALELADNPTRFLSTVQIGITLIGIVAGAVGGATVSGHVAMRLIQAGVEQRFAEPLSIGGVVLVLTFLSLVVGERSSVSEVMMVVLRAALIIGLFGFGVHALWFVAVIVIRNSQRPMTIDYRLSTNDQRPTTND